MLLVKQGSVCSRHGGQTGGSRTRSPWSCLEGSRTAPCFSRYESYNNSTELLVLLIPQGLRAGAWALRAQCSCLHSRRA